MQDNIARTGSNWSGKFPRTMQEAFPQSPIAAFPATTDPAPGRLDRYDLVAVLAVAIVALLFFGVI